MVTLSELYLRNDNWSVTNGMILFMNPSSSRIVLSGTNVVTLEDESDNFNYATTNTSFPVLDGNFIRGCADTSSALYTRLTRMIFGDTFSFFIRIRNQSDATTQTRLGPIFAFRQDGVCHWWLGVAARRNGKNMYGYAGTNTGLVLEENTLPDVTNNTIYTLTYIKSATEWKIYRDGVLAVTVSDSSTPDSSIYYLPTLFGDPWAPTTYYSVNNHAFSHIVIYDRVVSESERVQIEKDINDNKRL